MQIVNSPNIENATPSQTERAGGVYPIDSASKNGRALRNGPLIADSVELSSFSERLSRTMQAASAQQSQRITDLTAAVRSGQYQMDSQIVSHAMVSQAISAGNGGRS